MGGFLKSGVLPSPEVAIRFHERTSLNNCSIIATVTSHFVLSTRETPVGKQACGTQPYTPNIFITFLDLTFLGLPPLTCGCVGKERFKVEDCPARLTVPPSGRCYVEIRQGKAFMALTALRERWVSDTRG